MRSKIRSVAFAALAFVSYSCSENSITGPEFDTVRARAKAIAMPAVRFSEFHYDNNSTDIDEKIEISGPAGTDLTGWQIALYNGSVTQRTTYLPTGISAATWAAVLNGKIIPATCGARGVLVVAVPGLQNGSGTATGIDPDGFVLVNSIGGIVDSLAYEGSFVAANGPAVGKTIPDIGVRELGSTSEGLGTPASPVWSLARDAGGIWRAPAPNTFGACNDNDGTTPPPQAEVDHVSVSTLTPTVILGASPNFTAKAFDASNVEIPGTPFTWSTSDAAIATVDATGKVTTKTIGDVLVIATTANGKSGSASLHINPAPPPPPLPDIRFSEIHYDNFDVDTGEKIEIEGPANTDLTGWSIVLYNGNGGAVYLPSVVLSAAIQESCTGRGVVVVSYPTDGIQNGAPDGFALVNASNTVVEFLSYEGSFTAVGGPAAGMTSVDIIAKEDPAPAAGNSLQRKPDGSWEGPVAHSFGVCNGTGGTPPASTNQISFSGRVVPGDPALPVGFEDQLFATERDGATNAVITTTFTWTSETPSIASIDAFGVMHALSGGSATFRATATDGTTATYTLPTIVLSPGSSAQYGNNTEFGVPTDNNPADDYILTRAEFTSSFNATKNTPNWVSYNLDASHIAGAVDRCDCFTYDPQLPAAGFNRITTADYTGAGGFAGYGIDRGHLARSFDRTAAAYDNAQTYLFSNIIPQAAALNQGQWAQLENFLGNLATASNKEIYIITGPAGITTAGPLGNNGTVKNEGKIVIPAQVWKVAVIMDRNKGLADVQRASNVQVIAVIAQNTVAGNTDWHTWETTVDAVEALSGYDLLAALPDGIEAVVEGTTRAPISEPAGPYTAVEGSPVAFDGSASSDPDGDALTYAWQFGDGGTGTGISISHVYADNGSYTAILTATDPAGASDATDTPVTITNAAPVVTPVADFIANTGQLVTLSPSFSDAGANDSPWNYTINWGDGSSSTGAAASQGAFSSTHTYSTAGNYSLSVKVTDKDGGIGSSSLLAIVQAAPVAAVDGPYTSNEGSPVAMSGAASSDADGTVVSYAWDFGDGATDTGASVSHTYAQDGDYTVTLLVTDNDGLTSTIATTAHAANVGPAIGKGLGVVLQSNGSYAAAGSFTDPGADIWTATVDYGDGSGVSPLELNGKAFALSHHYAAGHTYTITVTVSDDDATSSDSYAVQVLAEPVSNAGGAYSSNEGSPVAMTGTASSDIDGSITSYAWSFGDGGSATGPTTSHTYAQDGDYTVTLVVTDNDGLTGTSTTTVYVSNVAASINSFAGATLLPGEGYNASGSFTDPGADTWTATVNYGDGSATSALGLSGKNFSLAHTYTAAGTFTVTVTVNDGGVTSTQTQTVTVLTPLQGANSALALLDQLVAGGKISSSDSKTLRNRLESAQKQIETDKANSNAATAHLDGALKELDKLIAAGEITAANASELRSMIIRLMATT